MSILNSMIPILQPILTTPTQTEKTAVTSNKITKADRNKTETNIIEDPIRLFLCALYEDNK